MKSNTDILKGFSVLVLDADGVLFSGKEMRLATKDGPIVAKTRSLIDGQGLTFLRALRIKVLIASGESEPLHSVVTKLNQLPSGQNLTSVEYLENLKGGEGKVTAIAEWLGEHNFTWDDVAYIGDDMTDYTAMQEALLKVVPANATRRLCEVADLKLSKHGGDGAIREFVEMVLDARGINELDLPVA